MTPLARMTALAHGDMRFAAELATDARSALATIGLPSPDPRPIVAVTEGEAPSGLVVVPWIASTRLDPTVREATEALLALDRPSALEACVASFDPRSAASTRFLIVGRNPIAQCTEDLVGPPTEGGGPSWSMCPGRTSLDRLAALDGTTDDLMMLPGAQVHRERGFHVVRHGARIIRCDGGANRAVLEAQASGAATTATDLGARAARTRLASRGLLVARPRTGAPALERWAVAGVSPSLAEHTARTASIHVDAQPEGARALGDDITEIARRYGIEHVPAPAGARTMCVVTDDLAHRDVEAMARGLHATKRRWIVVLWRTPFLVIMHGGGRGGPCLECARAALLEGPMAIALATARRSEWAPITGDVAMHVGRKLARVLSGVETRATVSAMERGHHRRARTETLGARPHCPVCGVAGLGDAIDSARTLRRPDLLEEAMEDGAQPEVATTRILALGPRLEGPWTGRWVRYGARRFTGDPAQRFLHRGEAPAGVLPGSDPAAHPPVPSSGKGQTHRQACAAAIGEAVQARATHFHRERERAIEVASEARLRDRGFDVITPDRIGRFSATQIAQRACVGVLFRRRAYAPRPYTGDERRRERRWVRARDLVSEDTVFVPAESVFRAVPDPTPTLVAGLRAGSAAGSSRLAATTAAIFERIERDALSMWWATRRRCPKIDLESTGDAWIDGAKRAIAAHGRSIAAIDITTTGDAPTVLSVSALLEPRDDASVERIVRSACAGTMIEALRAAIAENVQALPESVEGDAFPGVDPQWTEVRSWRALGANAPQWLEGTEPVTSVQAQREDGAAGDAIARYDKALEAAVDAGAERIVGVDMTRPGDPLRTVAVLTPGLRSQLLEKGPGRYDRLHRWSRTCDRTLAEGELSALGMVL